VWSSWLKHHRALTHVKTPKTLEPEHYLPANVCGQSNILQIRSHVSKFGDRVPASISRYSRTVTPSRYAA
jgi:hypothetical protein